MSRKGHGGRGVCRRCSAGRRRSRGVGRRGSVSGCGGGCWRRGVEVGQQVHLQVAQETEFGGAGIGAVRVQLRSQDVAEGVFVLCDDW